MITGYSNTISVTTSAPSLLLDLYPNAAVAFSVRKLRTAYTGSSIRVRRSSDNAEQDIGFVSGYLDTTTLLSFCAGTSGYVTTWYDQSGNGNNAIQSTAATQSRIVQGGVLETLTGTGTAKACINFTGSTWFNYTSSISIPDGTQYSAINVEQKSNLSVSLWSASNTGSPFTTLSYNDNYFYITGKVSTPLATFKGILQDPTPTIYRILSGYSKDSTISASIYSNNTLYTLTSGGNEANSNQFLYLGKRSPSEISNTKAQEHIIWLSNQEANQTAINNNMNTYYGIY